MIRKFVVLLFAIIGSNSIPAKSEGEIQLGASLNTLKWKIDNSLLGTSNTTRYNEIQITPLVRYQRTFRFKSKPLEKVRLLTFLGYSNFGGQLHSDTSDYKQVLSFHTVELGVMPSYNIAEDLFVGIGLKANYIPVARTKSYGTVVQSDNAPRSWIVSDISNSFKNASFNYGLLIGKRINRFSIQGEAWFGINNIHKNEVPFADIKATESNFRFILGYRIH